MDKERIDGFRSAFAPGETLFWQVPAAARERMAFYSENLPRLFSEKITAVFAVSDHYALEFMRFLQGQGIRVPEDVQIIGFDDTLASRESVPALTTIHQDAALRARTAIRRVRAGYFRIVAFSYLPMAVSTVLSAWLRCKEHAAVPFWAFSIVLFFLLIAIWMCAKLWLESKNDKAVPTISIIECSHNVCICKTHDFITYNSIVTFYKKDGNFEKLIGFGLVETINSGGKTAQIRIVPGDMRNKNQVSASEISDFVSYINDNKNNIIVRPTITSDIVPYIYKILNQEVSNE